MNDIDKLSLSIRLDEVGITITFEDNNVVEQFLLHSGQKVIAYTNSSPDKKNICNIVGGNLLAIIRFRFLTLMLL